MRTKSDLRGRGGHVPSPSAFLCGHCNRTVPGEAPGTQHRNHCPHCLWSIHVDLRTGDRRSGCHGRMEPIGVTVRYDGDWALLHRCQSCGLIRMNRIAGDDNPLALISLAVRPLGNPPFPMDQLPRMLPDGGEVQP